MTTATERPSTPAETLRRALNTHHRRHSPLYQGYLSDHGPMGALALQGLGRSEHEVLRWYERYCGKLDAVDEAPADYLEILAETERSLAELGGDGLLAAELPGLISGWTGDAFHPLIRLAYGYHFQIEGEIAAGLAYLKWCGPDETIEWLANSAIGTGNRESIQAAFSSLSPWAAGPGNTKRFDDRVAAVLAHPAFAEVAAQYPDTLASVSRAALSIFDQTHDFFALHLVTGAHAFRLLYPFAGKRREEIFSLGILAGYAAVGAPGFTTGQTDTNEQIDNSAVETAGALSRKIRGEDEHDIKLAYSALSQTNHFKDHAYVEAASRYLDR